MEDKIEQISISYTNDMDKDYLKKNGQFFTIHKKIIDRLFDKSIRPKNILEPSFGTGRIIIECKKFYPYAKIDAVEIDANLYEKMKNIIKGVNMINADFINWKTTNKYDLIIGNPPYFETNLYSNDEIRNGRLNIYALFIHKSIGLLKNLGQIRFVIPKSILTSKSFTKLREYIIKYTEVIDIIDFEDDDLFDRAKQTVIILVLQKKKNTGNYVMKFNDRIVFMKNDVRKLLKNTTSINGLGCIVKTGNIEWNKYKNELNYTGTTTKKIRLIRAENLVVGNGVKLYMKVTPENNTKIISVPCIMVNRIFGMKNPKLHMIYKKSRTPVFIENHINVIYGNKLDIIYKSLLNAKTIEFIKHFMSNTQISQHELQNIIPIYM